MLTLAVVEMAEVAEEKYNLVVAVLLRFYGAVERCQISDVKSDCCRSSWPVH